MDISLFAHCIYSTLSPASSQCNMQFLVVLPASVVVSSQGLKFLARTCNCINLCQHADGKARPEAEVSSSI